MIDYVVCNPCTAMNRTQELNILILYHSWVSNPVVEDNSLPSPSVTCTVEVICWGAAGC